ncbi:MAG: hypothetical protein JO257_13015 [Deltaproteobacteria bacterium]|nr:hypothetical protein [Deltaproteobacteria bacterium]
MQTKDSPQQLWRTQFDKQLTDTLVERVLKQTSSLIRQVQRDTPWRDQLGPDDRLNNILMKLLDGKLNWDPDRVNLEGFLFWAISREITHEVRHAKDFPHVSIDDESRNQERLAEEASDVLVAQRESKREEPVEPCWSLFVREMRMRAAGDVGVLAIVDAYAKRATTRAEVMDLTGMSKSAYHAAYQRMVRVAKKLDPEILETIVQAIA